MHQHIWTALPQQVRSSCGQVQSTARALSELRHVVCQISAEGAHCEGQVGARRPVDWRMLRVVAPCAFGGHVHSEYGVGPLRALQLAPHVVVQPKDGWLATACLPSDVARSPREGLALLLTHGEGTRPIHAGPIWSAWFIDRAKLRPLTIGRARPASARRWVTGELQPRLSKTRASVPIVERVARNARSRGAVRAVPRAGTVEAVQVLRRDGPARHERRLALCSGSARIALLAARHGSQIDPARHGAAITARSGRCEALHAPHAGDRLVSAVLATCSRGVK